jgi:hypothetical protein
MGTPGELYVGTLVDGGERVVVGADDLTTHGVIVGMTGSGKTGLGVVAIEEALLSGVATLVIDPKGDMANLCLRFPDMAAADFLPWIDEGQAAREGRTPEDVAASTAQLWRDGLARSGVAEEEIRRLAAIPTTVYTPGSTSGVGLDLVGSLAAPGEADAAAVTDEVTDTVSGLLALLGIESDPLTGREHILLTNLLTNAWTQGRSLDLAALIGEVQQPPLRKLGVMELDTFFPPADRTALAMRLNGLLASPTFAAWSQGVPLDVAEMLFTPEGGPRCAVVSLSHLDEGERQFVVTLLLSRLITWMRRQPGTSSLRALVYMDEVFGFVPPVKAPPAKQPILTILKQARAFGVGMVLATQNPVDLDYKAISNAGTWMVGRLQTERDKDRLLDGMRSSSGAVDVGAVSERISSLDKRQFVLHTARGGQPTTFGTRWAVSYLAGPMTGPQIERLMADQKAAAAAPAPAPSAAPAPAPSAAPAPAGGASVPPVAPLPAPPPPDAVQTVAPDAVQTVAPAAPAASPAGLAGDESTVAPAVPDGVPQRILDPAATWAAAVGAVPGGTRLEPHVAVRVRLTFDEARMDLDHTEEFEAVLPVPTEPTDLSGLVAVDHDDRDLRTEVPPGAVYVLPAAKIATKTWWSTLERAVRDHLLAGRRLQVLANEPVGLWSRPTEDRAAFEARCRVVADDRADIEAEAIRTKMAAKADRIHAAMARAQDRVAQLETDVSTRRTGELVNLGSSILGGFLGGRRSARGVAADLRRAAERRGQTSRTGARLDAAQGDVVEAADELDALEDELAADILDIEARWVEAAGAITEVEVGLEKADVQVASVALVWVPTAR